MIQDTRKVHLTPSYLHGKYSIRFVVTNEHAVPEHIDYCWKLVKNCADEVLKDVGSMPEPVPVQDDAVVNKLRQQRLSDFAVPITHYQKTH
jgi:hypothetical protein